MSSRTEEKRRAREARERAERAQAARGERRRRLLTLGGVLAAAALVLVVAIAASRAGSGDEAPTAQQATALFAGIPQDGPWLGRPDAPVVVEEYADLQCPFCALAARDTIPPLVREYVRTGQVRLRFRALAFLDPVQDSTAAARAALSAGLQDRLWPFVERFYAQQGEEGSGYVTPAFLRGVAREVPGLDVTQMFARTADAAIGRALSEDEQAMAESGVSGTPAFLVGRRGGELQAAGPDIGALREAIDPLLAAGT